MPFHVLSGTTAPTIAPDHIGQHYINTTEKSEYVSVGVGSISDWRKSGDNAFPPLNAPPLPNSLPGSNNLAVHGEGSQWFTFVAPTAGFLYYRILFNGLGAQLWSAAFYNMSGVQVDASANNLAGTTNPFLQVNESNFTPADTYFVRILNATPALNVSGRIYYTHAN